MTTINYKNQELKIEFIDDAVPNNYGTDGGVRYQQNAIIEGEEVTVFWDITEEYEDNGKRYNQLLSIQIDSELDEEESDELYHLECFFGDESQACDWENADLITLRDGGDFEF